jgi:hypothetical protein
MVNDAGEVALPAAVTDLVDADRDETLEAPFVEVVCDDALDDPPDRVPGDPQQAGDRRRSSRRSPSPQAGAEGGRMPS